MDQSVINRIGNPVNSVSQAYESRTAQLDQRREAEQQKQLDAQKQRDNDMLKVFEFAGDGRTDEAKYLAQSKGLQVPEQIFTNADFAKGLTLAGKIYGDDPVAAEKFTKAWMSNPVPDFTSRLTLAQQAAGPVRDPDDRKFQQAIRLEQWKLKNKPAGVSGTGGFSLSPGQTRYDAQGNPIAAAPAEPPVSRFVAGQNAYNQVMSSGLATPDQAEAARQEAYRYWDREYRQKPQATPQAGAQSVAQPVPAPSGQQLPLGLPPGSVMIGTANGRPVYQAPNGERFIDDGNP